MTIRSKIATLSFSLIIIVTSFYNASQTYNWISKRPLIQRDPLSLYESSPAGSTAVLGKLIRDAYKENTAIYLPDEIRTFTVKERLSGLHLTERRLNVINERHLRIFVQPRKVTNKNYRFLLSSKQMQPILKDTAVRYKHFHLIGLNATDIGFLINEKEIAIVPFKTDRMDRKN